MDSLLLLYRYLLYCLLQDKGILPSSSRSLLRLFVCALLHPHLSLKQKIKMQPWTTRLEKKNTTANLRAKECDHCVVHCSDANSRLSILPLLSFFLFLLDIIVNASHTSSTIPTSPRSCLLHTHLTHKHNITYPMSAANINASKTKRYVFVVPPSSS